MLLTQAIPRFRFFDGGNLNVVGDGVADDTAALQSAVNLALASLKTQGGAGTSGGVAMLYLPGTIYKTTAPIAVNFTAQGAPASSGLVICGEVDAGFGATIAGNFPNAGDLFVLTQGAGGDNWLTFDGIQFDDGGAGLQNNAINANAFGNVLFLRRCRFGSESTNYGHGITGANANLKVVIDGCFLGGIAATFGPVAEVVIRGCLDNWDQNAFPAVTIGVNGGAPPGSVVVVGNTRMDLTLNGTTGAVVSGNRIRNVTLNAASSLCVVQGNRIDGVVTNNGTNNSVQAAGGGAPVAFPLTNSGDEGFQPNGIANNALNLHNNAAAVNGVQVTGSAAGATTTIAAFGGDTNILLTLSSKGSSGVRLTGGSQALELPGNGLQSGQIGAGVMAIGFDTAQFNVWDNVGGKGFRFFDVFNAVQRWAVDGAGNATFAGSVLGTANPAVFGATANVQVKISAFQASLLLAQTGGGGLQLQTRNSANAVVSTLDDGNGNATLAGFLQVGPGKIVDVSAAGTLFFGTTNSTAIQVGTGGSATGSVTLGGSASIGLVGQAALTATGVASGVNGVTATQTVTTVAPSVKGTGGDTNVGLVLTTKGTGKLFTAAPYAAGADQTAGRNITGGTNTNGSNRRRVTVVVRITGAAASSATATYTTTAGGTALTAMEAAFSNAAAGAADQMFTFSVDPGATYSVNNSITGTATIALQKWIEVDE